MKIQSLLTAIVMNLKKLAVWSLTFVVVFMQGSVPTPAGAARRSTFSAAPPDCLLMRLTMAPKLHSFAVGPRLSDLRHAGGELYGMARPSGDGSRSVSGACLERSALLS